MTHHSGWDVSVNKYLDLEDSKQCDKYHFTTFIKEAILFVTLAH